MALYKVDIEYLQKFYAEIEADNLEEAQKEVSSHSRIIDVLTDLDSWSQEWTVVEGPTEIEKSAWY